jgi:hypothetical protein
MRTYCSQMHLLLLVRVQLSITRRAHGVLHVECKQLYANACVRV